MQTIGAAILATALAVSATPASAETDRNLNARSPTDGTVKREDGLGAFNRVYKVVTHPRCANCHVGADNMPMWSGPSYGETRPHGMNVNAGMSVHEGAKRCGPEALPCSTCHRKNDNFDTEPHAPPRAGLDWCLPPAELAWFNKSAAEVCAQLSDPERNGGLDWMELAKHLITDAKHHGFVLWGWQPGGGREPAPYSLQEHVYDILVWGTSGMPCPPEE